MGFPDGTVYKNLSAKAGDMGSIPGPGRFHMPWVNWACVPQLLGLCAATAEAHVPRTPCSTAREATPLRKPGTTSVGRPCSLQLEKARVQQWRPSAAQN